MKLRGLAQGRKRLFCQLFSHLCIYVSICLEANRDYEGALKTYEQILTEDPALAVNNFSLLSPLLLFLYLIDAIHIQAVWKRKVCIYRGQGRHIEAADELTKYLKVFAS